MKFYRKFKNIEGNVTNFKALGDEYLKCQKLSCLHIVAYLYSFEMTCKNVLNESLINIRSFECPGTKNKPHSLAFMFQEVSTLSEEK